LNSFFDCEAAPIQVAHFGSLFRFTFRGNLDLFFYHLLNQGLYIWEGRNCFLSTAHSEADLDYVRQAVETSVLEMKRGHVL
jgi:glutamate-1-semialdehyde aminotransferase